jgi:TetR/AcrR family transcriptional regulator, transcriptional repressor for nem operon
MARPREFDEAKALEKAIQCFWERGYEATSMRDLETKMGISAPSLYNTYGDKHALFAQALERYLDHSARALIKRFEDSLPPKQAIRRFVEEIVKDSINDRERRGCFLVNSALEVAPHDRELGTFIPRLRLSFTDQLKRRKLRELSLEIVQPRISRACCSASCSAFGFSPVRSPNGP